MRKIIVFIFLPMVVYGQSAFKLNDSVIINSEGAVKVYHAELSFSNPAARVVCGSNASWRVGSTTNLAIFSYEPKLILTVGGALSALDLSGSQVAEGGTLGIPEPEAGFSLICRSNAITKDNALEEMNKIFNKRGLLNDHFDALSFYFRETSLVTAYDGLAAPPSSDKMKFRAAFRLSFDKNCLVEWIVQRRPASSREWRHCKPGDLPGDIGANLLKEVRSAFSKIPGATSTKNP